MNTFTIVILGIICLFALLGYHRGFLRMVLSVVSLAITIYVSVMISPTVSTYLQSTPLYDSVYQASYDYVEQTVAETTDHTITGMMDSLPFPKAMKESIIDSESVRDAGNNFASGIAKQLTIKIFDALVFVATFAIATIIVRLAITALNIMTYIPLIHGVNQILGILLGLGEGLLLIWIFFVLLGFFSNTEWAAVLYQQIAESPILSFLYNNNFIMSALSK